MKVKKIYPIRKNERIESELAQAIDNISDGSIQHFGASDAQENSHLFYFTSAPWQSRAFIELILTARYV